MTAPHAADLSIPPAKPPAEIRNRNFIWRLLQYRGAKSYMEIGVRDGATLAAVECPAIGVDPVFAFDRDPMGKKRVLHLYQMTSDDFFREHDPRGVFGRAVDVAYLDGMHQFEFLLRDFMNAERCCEPGSLILLDDCLPVNIEMTEREHAPDARTDPTYAGWWTGDVWRVVEILREHRPDLRILPVDTFPAGTIVVSGLDPASRVLSERYDDIVERYGRLELTPERFVDYWRRNHPLDPRQLTDEHLAPAAQAGT